MTRRIHRTGDFHITLEIKQDTFLRPPRDAQRNWMLNRSMREFADELVHLDAKAPSFVHGSDGVSMADRTQGSLDDDEIMEDWQIPVMQAMANLVTESGGDVLEIGFGRGVASDMIQKSGVHSHTIVECNDSVIARYNVWKEQYPNADIRMLEGRWQDRVSDMQQYDGIFFHTYPLNEEDFVEQVVQSVTFASHFFSTAAEHLKPGGVFTYLTNEFDSLSRGHQHALFDHFAEFTLSKVNNLSVPENTRDAMWADSMVIVRAVK